MEKNVAVSSSFGLGKYVRMSARVAARVRLLVEDREEECVSACPRAIVCLRTCISMIKEHGNIALAIYC